MDQKSRRIDSKKARRRGADRTSHMVIPGQTAAEIGRRAQIREELHDARAKVIRSRQS